MNDALPSKRPKRDLTYWVALILYSVFGFPFVFTVAFHVLMAPILALKLLNPPAWLDLYLFTPLSFMNFALSAYCVWWGWKLVSRQLDRRAV